MTRTTYFALIAAMSMCCAAPTMAELGTTDGCQKEARELMEKIHDDKDDYTAESRRKAKQDLMQAKTNRLNPIKCRGHIHDARQELRKGKS